MKLGSNLINSLNMEVLIGGLVLGAMWNLQERSVSESNIITRHNPYPYSSWTSRGSIPSPDDIRYNDLYSAGKGINELPVYYITGPGGTKYMLHTTKPATFYSRI